MTFSLLDKKTREQIDSVEQACSQDRNKTHQIFHLSLTTTSLKDTRYFYERYFDCEVRRITKTGKGMHINFYGNQLTFVEVNEEKHRLANGKNEHGSPLVHFGVALPYSRWLSIKDLLKENEINFCVKPHLKFEGEAHEHYVLFLKDPSGNAIELKSFTKTNDWL